MDAYIQLSSILVATEPCYIIKPFPYENFFAM